MPTLVKLRQKYTVKGVQNARSYGYRTRTGPNCCGPNCASGRKKMAQATAGRPARA